MARPPITDEELIARYGPHLNEAPPGGWDAGLEVDKVVNTHCCFCGQQCGIKLKVHDNAVVGFEPWYEFPFNEGKLCPKGVKRYLQGSHPDRLLHPMERDADRTGRVPHHHLGSGARPGRRRDPADPGRVRRRRVRHVVGGVADEREELPRRQVRPPRVAHRQPRLQRPLLHGVGRHREQEGARRRSGTEPVERHPARRRGVGRRLERRRDVPDHHQLHLAGPRPWRQADRPGPTRRAARPHRRSVPPGAAGHRLGAVRCRAARADRPRLARPRLHRRPHRGLRRGRRRGRRDDPGVGGRHHRCAGGAHRAGRRAVGHVGDGDDAARPRHRAAHQGRRQRARRDQPRARHRQVRQAGLRCVDDHRAGQRPRRTRARPQVRPAARQPRHHQPRAPRRTSPRCGTATSPTSPARASRPRS